MRRLLLIRHAKSSWKNHDGDDHERPLNQRGEQDSILMARHLADKGEELNIIFSSTATRALDFAQQLSDFTHVTLEPDLSFYTFDQDELLEILHSLPDNANRIAIVGHNPAITRVASKLASHEFDNIPTAGIVALNCDAESWSELSVSDCEIDYFEYPKMFK